MRPSGAPAASVAAPDKHDDGASGPRRLSVESMLAAMRLFSARHRPVHLGPLPLERLARRAGSPALEVATCAAAGGGDAIEHGGCVLSQAERTQRVMLCRSRSEPPGGRIVLDL